MIILIILIILVIYMLFTKDKTEPYLPGNMLNASDSYPYNFPPNYPYDDQYKYHKDYSRNYPNDHFYRYPRVTTYQTPFKPRTGLKYSRSHPHYHPYFDVFDSIDL